MPDMMGPILLLLACYALGSVPFGLLISKMFYGKDIRKYGSSNTGATNVWRVLGKGPGISTLLLDIVKGAAAPLCSTLVFPGNQALAVGCGFSSIMGHNWSLFLKGKGGKGVATSAGVFLALMPKQTAIALLAFAIVFLTTRYVSAGSLAGALALLAATFLFPSTLLIKIVVVVSTVIIFVKHIPNLKRIFKGEEPKVKLR